MDKEINGKDVAAALRKLADAIDNNKATDAFARCELELQQVGMITGVGFVVTGNAPTGNVVMTVRFKPEKIGE